jgi:hypothetical protein
VLARGLTEDGAAQVLGWSKVRVTPRVKIVGLRGAAQGHVGSGEVPVRGIDALLEIQAVSPKLAALVAEVVPPGRCGPQRETARYSRRARSYSLSCNSVAASP